MIRVYLRGFVAVLALAVLVHSQQDHTGYTDESTTLDYAPDELYIDTGINVDVSPPYRVPTLQQQLQNVRSFPKGSKNYYTLRSSQGKGANYLVRAIFMYGNYDFLDNPPTFELHLGVDVWDTIKLDNSSHIVMKEMIHSPSTDFLYVCLANIGSGTPFISALELRQVNDSIYKRESGSLELLYRYYSHKTSVDNIRYNDDIFDRIWEPMYLVNGSQISTEFDVISTLNVFQLPPSVMKAAIIPVNVSEPIHFTYTPTTNKSLEFYIYLHLAELSTLSANQVREFNVTVNGLHLYGPYVPLYLTADTIYNNKALTGSQLDVFIQSTERSTLPPILLKM
ncbi:putative leucine-rich repeat receptor-like protein kinase At2g19210 [Chenopodium quinoa]|uniref:putative leucine-rich repeat receptor-like protein kinase At2g19210 n=1 Tax=Chenopodium quinoa TaxID=63459 RepID=UPI000B7978E0|nr:putative leucine-rich repeat receptor-like protein kinase At2g19210 [Chenopodium quinoa]